MKDVVKRAERELDDILEKPWIASYDDDYGHTVIDTDLVLIAQTWGPRSAEHAAFIASARELIPELINEITSLRAKLDGLKEFS